MNANDALTHPVPRPDAKVDRVDLPDPDRGDTAQDDTDKDAHITRLILEKHACHRTIEELRDTIHRLQREVAQLRREVGALPEPFSADTEGGPAVSADGVTYRKRDVRRLTGLNTELVEAVETLQAVLTRERAGADEERHRHHAVVAELDAARAALEAENDALKGRLAGDLLRRREANRMEVAAEKLRGVARLRLEGRRQLERMEAALMEAHDDLYHIQRGDALFAPQRTVSFVFQGVSIVRGDGGSDGVELAMRACDEMLAAACAKYHGYRACVLFDVGVFAFQSPRSALEFARECHEQALGLPWPALVEKVACFASVSDFGSVLFRGPRLHTCIFACTPEVEVDPITGRTAFFGAALEEGLQAALELSSVGEIVVNDTWADLLAREACLHGDGAPANPPKTLNQPEPGDGTAVLRDLVMGVRNTLGKTWDVVTLSGRHNIICSILPKSLQGRRDLGLCALWPTPTFPEIGGADHPTVVKALMQAMKDTRPSASAAKSFRDRINAGYRKDLPRMEVAYTGIKESIEETFAQEDADSFHGEEPAVNAAAQLMELHVLQLDKDRLLSGVRQLGEICAALERKAMEAEDHFVLLKDNVLEVSKIAYICIVDIGDDKVWKHACTRSPSEREYEQLRRTLQSFVHDAAKKHHGFFLKGNDADVFAYMYAQVEDALAFAIQVYVMVNQAGNNLSNVENGNGEDSFLFRGAISSVPMRTFLRNYHEGVFKCTNSFIRLSAALCSVARWGEVLATEDVIQTFYTKQENVVDTQYNIVKQYCRFLKGWGIPVSAFSILPRSFAYRRQVLLDKTQSIAPYQGARSIEAVLISDTEEISRAAVESVLQQQLEQLERGEAVRLAEEDAFEKTPQAAEWVLCNPWMVTTRTQHHQSHLNYKERSKKNGRKENSLSNSLNWGSFARYGHRFSGAPGISREPFAFLYCNIARAATIVRDLSPSLTKEVFAHYNYIVQAIFAQCGGFVAKTDSVAGYLVVFERPFSALEAAFRIQKRLLASQWPEELRTLPSTLFSRDAATGTVLFNGPRVQVGLHFSPEYAWRALPHNHAGEETSGRRQTELRVSIKKSEEAAFPGVLEELPFALNGGPLAASLSVIDVKGAALEELCGIGHLAYGGEVRMSLPFRTALAEEVSGRLLLDQFRLEIIVDAAQGGGIPFEKEGGPGKEVEKAPHARAKPMNSDELPRGRGGDRVSPGAPPAAVVLSAVPALLEGRRRYFAPSDERVSLSSSVLSGETTHTGGVPGRKGGPLSAIGGGGGGKGSPLEGSFPLLKRPENGALAGSRRPKGPLPLPAEWGVAVRSLPRAARVRWGVGSSESSSPPPPSEMEQILHAMEQLLALFERATGEENALQTRPAVSPATSRHPSQTSEGEYSYYRVFMYHATQFLQFLYAAIRIGGEGIRLPSPSSGKENGISPLLFADASETPFGGSLRVQSGRKNPLCTRDRGRVLSHPAVVLPRLGSRATATSQKMKNGCLANSRGGRMNFPSLVPISSARSRSPSPSSKSQNTGRAKGGKMEPYREAVEYLEEACRCLKISIGTALGRFPIRASAPSPRSKHLESRMSGKMM
ncbi:unnamed protein product [Phytomonas sp. EM1]|nr:unnamed protein product [Phytomonas sp. EM1]|eukprot:CCW60575.1 unnamed protein product [Phytomonas sp. isolate EM1]